MKLLPLSLLPAIALPINVNALTWEERFDICARHRAHQITYQEVAELLSIKELTIDKEDRYNGSGMPRDIKQSVKYYCDSYIF